MHESRRFKLVFATLATFVLLCLILAAASVEAKQPNHRIDNDNLKQDSRHQNNWDKSSRYEDQANEIDDRIIVVEPYKSLLQTTTRYALIQTKIADHTNIDAAMAFINAAGFMLSKPSRLVKVVKSVAVGMATLVATLLATTFFFPGAFVMFERTWRDPFNTLGLDSYMTDGISDKTLLNTLSSGTDDILGKFGLLEKTCREKSLCYFGSMLNCTFPESASSIAKFASDNFSNVRYDNNRYVKAFLAGFVDSNCANLNLERSEQSTSCLNNFINSVIMPRFLGDTEQSRQKPIKYQTLQVGRAQA